MITVTTYRGNTFTLPELTRIQELALIYHGLRQLASDREAGYRETSCEDIMVELNRMVQKGLKY